MSKIKFCQIVVGMVVELTGNDFVCIAIENRETKDSIGYDRTFYFCSEHFLKQVKTIDLDAGYVKAYKLVGKNTSRIKVVKQDGYAISPVVVKSTSVVNVL